MCLPLVLPDPLSIRGSVAQLSGNQAREWAYQSFKVMVLDTSEVGRSVRIVVPDDESFVMAPSAAFRKLDGYDVRTYNTLPSNRLELMDRIDDAEVVINMRSSCAFDGAVFDACPTLEMISIWGTGTDNVDLPGARARGICVTNTPSVSKHVVAEHTLALMLSAARRIIEVDQRLRSGEWPRAMIAQLHGKTLGLIGLGAIGAQVARLGVGIGMKVIAWTFHPTDTQEQEIPLRLVEFDEVFAQADVVSVHVRHTPETDRFITAKQFQIMKPSALFVNTARGGVVDEKALISALRGGQIAAAGLDVFTEEPLSKSSQWFDLSNVVLTPHLAALSPETTEMGLLMTIENIFAYLDGSPVHVVS